MNFGDVNQGDRKIIKTVALISSTLSFIGSLFIVVSWMLFARLRTFPFRLVLYLSIAVIGNSLATILAIAEKGMDEPNGCVKTSVLCSISGFLMQFFEVASFFWILNISINLYLILVKKVGNAIFGFEKTYHQLYKEYYWLTVCQSMQKVKRNYLKTFYY